MVRKTFIHGVVLAFILWTGAVFHGQTAEPAEAPGINAWARLPVILARIVPPKFARRKFPVTRYGAIGDGITDCTKAFRSAIDDCTRSGGGQVIVEGGIFLTGAIHLKNNVDLCVEKDATILFTTNRAAYLPDVLTRYEGTEVMNYSPLVYAFDQTNIAITGSGTLDGQGTAWHLWKSSTDPNRLVRMADEGVPAARRIFGSDGRLRPNFVAPFHCRNVLIEGIHIRNSPMWVLNPVFCANVTIRNVTVDTRGPNTDGCDPDSCTDVLIRDCSFSDGDDCIAIKSGRDRDGRRVDVPCQNIVIQNCMFKAGHGGIGIGSETSGGVRDVFAENCQFDSPDLEMAIRLKTNPARGGYIKNIYIRNCSVKLAKVGIDMTLRYASSGAMDGESVPVIRDVCIQKCTFARLTQRPVFIQGWSPADPISNVGIIQCHFLHAAETSIVTNATRLTFQGSSGY